MTRKVKEQIRRIPKRRREVFDGVLATLTRKDAPALRALQDERLTGGWRRAAVAKRLRELDRRLGPFERPLQLGDGEQIVSVEVIRAGHLVCSNCAAPAPKNRDDRKNGCPICGGTFRTYPQSRKVQTA